MDFELLCLAPIHHASGVLKFHGCSGLTSQLSDTRIRIGGNNSAFEGCRLKEKDHGKVKMRRIFISGRVK